MMGESRLTASIATFFFALALSFSSVALAVTDPQALVRETAETVLQQVTARKTELEADASQIYALVENTVVPRFDFRSMAQSAMGRFWRRASDQQKVRLTYEFRELLVRTYATALLSYSGQKIEYLPVRMKTDARKVNVPTRISSAGSPAIPVNYRMHLKNSDNWLVYDVVIDGISLVTNYRGTFRDQVRRGGVDGLIETLARKNAKSRG